MATNSLGPAIFACSLFGLIACAGPDACRPTAPCSGEPLARSSTELEAPPGTPPSRPLAELLVGNWRMVAEAPADGKGGFFQQERRLLELDANGHYQVENHVESRRGEWVLTDRALTLGEHPVRVESVDEHTLVLVEALPEIYLREGGPRQVRNTYRRVAESEFGPMLGAPVEQSLPTAGHYTGSYAYYMQKFPTMEISISQAVVGRARLELAADNTMSACFGVVRSDHSSISEYASHDGQRHVEESETRSLIGVRGRWTQEGDHIRVEAQQFWRRSCASEDEGDPLTDFAFECVELAANESLPIPVLACRIDSSFSSLREIAINPADTERSGPYTMQLEPRGHISTDPGRPWLLLAAEPGLHVNSSNDRSAQNPVVSFEAKPVDFVESNFVEEDPQP